MRLRLNEGTIVIHVRLYFSVGIQITIGVRSRNEHRFMKHNASLCIGTDSMFTDCILAQTLPCKIDFDYTFDQQYYYFILF